MSILKKMARRRKKLSEQTSKPTMQSVLATQRKRRSKKLKVKYVTEVDGDWQC